MPYNPAQDPYVVRSGEVSSQARGAVAVIPSDTVDLAPYAKALYIGSAGDLKVIPINNVDGSPVVFANHPVGYCPVQVRRVLATGTVASGILALSA